MRKNKMCLSYEMLFAMTENGISSIESAAAFQHLEFCESCRQRFREMEDVEYRLRLAGMELQSSVSTSDIGHLVAGALQRISATRDRQDILNQSKEDLHHALTSLCGERLSQHSIEVASRQSIADAASSLEDEWKSFVSSLEEILYSVCGDAVRQAVHEISGCLLMSEA